MGGHNVSGLYAGILVSNAYRNSMRLGSELGQGPGQFALPISFDASPDGRVYVLDAGNTRIQVFDLEGGYVTQWGSEGSEWRRV